MPQNYVLPAFATLINGVPLRHEFEAAVGSAILPRDLVEFDTNYCEDGKAHIKEASYCSENVIGVADQHPLEDENYETPLTRAYTAGEAVRVLSGIIVVALRLAAGQTITCGELLKPSHSGEVRELDCESGTSDPYSNACLRVAQALASYASATVMQFIIAKLLI